jgi:hypothetical protein
MVVFTISTTVLAFSNENRITMGFEYGNFFEKRTDSGVDFDTYMGSPGFNLSSWHLWDNVGFFFHNSFLAPSNVSSNRDGFDYFFHYNLILGPAFKIGFNKRLDLSFAIGFSLGVTAGEANNKTLNQFNMGLGGDIGLSYHINRVVFVSVGSLLSYHFMNVTNTGTGTYVTDEDGNTKDIEETAMSKNYNMAGIRPYIKIGFLIEGPRSRFD